MNETDLLQTAVKTFYLTRPSFLHVDLILIAITSQISYCCWRLLFLFSRRSEWLFEWQSTDCVDRLIWSRWASQPWPKTPRQEWVSGCIEGRPVFATTVTGMRRKACYSTHLPAPAKPAWYRHSPTLGLPSTYPCCGMLLHCHQALKYPETSQLGIDYSWLQ